MPASIVVESGITAGSTHPIEKPVVRIGSAAQADVRIPSQQLADHALTLEYRGGAYYVHNRDRTAVTVGREELPRGQAARWSAGQALRTHDGTRLLLLVEGDPAPRPVAADERSDAADDDVDDVSTDLRDLAEAARTVKPARTMEICVTVVCALGGLLLLLGDSSPPPTEPGVSLATIVQSWQGEPAVMHQLQHARNEFDAGNEAAAREMFLRIRNRLLSRTGGLTGERSQEEEQLLRYVAGQLAKL